jgi:hypothetical protein
LGGKRERGSQYEGDINMKEFHTGQTEETYNKKQTKPILQ